MVTVKFIFVIAGARIIKLWSSIMLSFLSGSQSFATACQAEMSEAPRQAEPGNASSPGVQRAAATCQEQGKGSQGGEGFL